MGQETVAIWQIVLECFDERQIIAPPSGILRNAGKSFLRSSGE